jgi:hypothetical protein
LSAVDSGCGLLTLPLVPAVPLVLWLEALVVVDAEVWLEVLWLETVVWLEAVEELDAVEDCPGGLPLWPALASAMLGTAASDTTPTRAHNLRILSSSSISWPLPGEYVSLELPDAPRGYTPEG